MNKFEKQLEKWNNGVLRGAQAKLAKTLKVSTAATALWATGKRRPSKGYVAQMARLFGLDIYQVIKLFEMPIAVTYPTPSVSAHALHEQTAHNAYHVGQLPYNEDASVQGNTVSLPFFTHLPLTYPKFSDENILEWWSIPRRYAQGAKYIVRSNELSLPDCQQDTDLCFIKPCRQAAQGQAVLLTDGKKVFVLRTVLRNGTLTYQTLSGTRAKVNPPWRVIGIITSRIKPF